MASLRIILLGLLAPAAVSQGGIEDLPLPIPKQAGHSTELRDKDIEDGESATAGIIDNCDDLNFCTDDSRGPTGVCIHVNNSKPCDDNSACTIMDTCSNGACIGTSLNCDDGNMCTLDFCNPMNGCVHLNTSGPCDDGFFCNGRDTCSGGSCNIHTGNPCPANDPCDEQAEDCSSGGLTSLISLKAVSINNVPLTPGTCNLALSPPRCATGNVDRPCASNSECHVGTSFLIPNKCAGGANLGQVCSTNANCPGSTCISVFPGDQIQAEIFLSRWAIALPDGVRIFQARTNAAGYTGFENGTVLPLGWCAPATSVPCTSDETCPPEYPICAPLIGCSCAGHNPNPGAFVTASRKDFLFNGLDLISLVDTSFISYTYFGLAVNEPVLDLGFPRYLGTLVLKVSTNACGTFVIGFVNEIGSTFIADPANPPNQALPTSQSLILTLSDCSRQLLYCNPGHCNVDARIGHDPNDMGTFLNTDTIQMTFSKTTTNPNMDLADFEISVVPSDPEDVLPEISSVTPNNLDPRTTTILLDRPIQQDRWTCIRDVDSNKRCCMGSLPGDTDNNRISNLNDVFEALDNVLGIVNPHLPIEKCDTDRSQHCSPADLLMIGDLLNGADSFDPSLNHTLPALVPACPDMRLPQ